MAEHHSPAPSSLSPPPPHEEHAPWISDRLDIIRQIALTNQLTVSWDDLRKALKDELELVLESNQLTYTASRVTNPLTTALTAIPSTIATTAEDASSITDANTTGQEQVTAGEALSTDTTTKASEDDQPHVPENDQETQQPQDTHTQEATTTTTAEAADKKPEGSVVQVEGGQATSTEAIVSKDDTPEGAEAKDKESQEEFNGPASVEKQDDDDYKNKEKTPEQQEQGQPVNEDAANVVPISINTLLLETPQGYHDRIRGLLDAFSSAPFTIQRVCELISSPTEHHTNLIKYLRAVEKVLMITSSISEFSNPAYNGPSALDEKDDEAHQRGGEGTVNGDYSQSKNLDFSLISTKRPSSDGSDDEDEDEDFGAGVSAHGNNINGKEAYDAVLAEVDAFEARFGTGKEKLGDEGAVGDEEEEDGLSALEAEDNAAEATTTTASAGDVSEEMDVDDDQIAGETTGVTSTMEGVESERSSETAVEGGMEVDQA
ncbi:hypothetical protein EC957_008190 [Mortierella hygrophila]|uniref:Serine/threonine-protein phosphatase 4 regulatory subunit 2 n=1 Tax=Mortierella hygrophila TaxID=979708 RepID=A0A9P6K868_9FUNG|nr:hypothetical protein EC957_008190 [Mortierella hygrophila]